MSQIAIILIGLMWFGPTTAPTAPLKDRERAAALNEQGWKLWQAQKVAEAEAKFAESVALDPANAERLWELSLTLIQ